MRGQDRPGSAPVPAYSTSWTRSKAAMAPGSARCARYVPGKEDEFGGGGSPLGVAKPLVLRWVGQVIGHRGAPRQLSVPAVPVDDPELVGDTDRVAPEDGALAAA